MTRVVGIDVGGTKVAATALGAALGAEGLEEHRQQPTRLDNGEELIAQLVEIVGEAAADEPLDAVGIGVPSIVRFETGEIAASTNIPLKGVALRSVLGERLGIPVFVDNDATVAALAEAYDESLEMVSRNLVMITVGTGIGGGIVIDGRIFRGGSGGAGELGMTLIGLNATTDLPPASDQFPQLGSLEALASGTALDRLATAAAAAHPDSALGRLVAANGIVHAVDAVGCRSALGARARCRDRQRDQHLRPR
jgi:glucokinase